MRVTVPMFEKGRSFVLAGGLVAAYEGHRFVYLHLLCQGFECIGKALLLAHNYDVYKLVLKNDFGHDLKRLLLEIDKVSNSAFFSNAATREVIRLSEFYKKHMFRYGDAFDFEESAEQLSAENMHTELVDSLIELNVRFSGLNNNP